MKKLTLGLIIGIIVIFGITGCNTNNNKTIPTEETTTVIVDTKEETTTAIVKLEPETEIETIVEEKVALKPVSEVAEEIVLGMWAPDEGIQQRIEEAGYNYYEVQAAVEARIAEIEAEEQAQNQYYEDASEYEYVYYGDYSPSDFMYAGVIYWGDWRFTWYSENVLPGGGLNIPGRWSDGNFVRDENGYICVASSDLDWGTILETPWGTGRVYDSGCSSGTIDIYVSW